VPAILRAKRLVVAGDDRQLPPTAFFTSQAAEDDAEEEELAIELAATKGFESILGSLRSLLRLRMLTWHYRSRDERLIAFSNVQFYRLPLSTRNA
jgi:superfamily I DNA and/or RNA helicase